MISSYRLARDSPSQALQSVVDLGFQSLTACLFFISITFKSSSTSCLHLLFGLPLFHLLGITSAKVSQNAVDFLPSLQGDTAVIL